MIIINLYSVFVTDILGSCDEYDNDADGVCPLPNSLFNSPIQVTPLFKSMAAGIPSPQFSESVSLLHHLYIQDAKHRFYLFFEFL